MHAGIIIVTLYYSITTRILNIPPCITITHVYRACSWTELNLFSYTRIDTIRFRDGCCLSNAVTERHLHTQLCT